jgi:hypothetical protein
MLTIVSAIFIVKKLLCRQSLHVVIVYSLDGSVGFEVCTAVGSKVAIFWNKAPCSPYMNQRFGRRYHFHLQGRKSV